MKNLIFKKFLTDTTNFFLLSCLTIGLIVWIIQAVNFLDFITEDGHNLRVYSLYTILSLPKIISRIIPFTFFVSLFYLLLKYESNNELIIFWNFGISKTKFANILIKYSFVFIVIQLILTSYVVPVAQDKARSYIRSSNVDFFPSLIKEKKFTDTVSKLTIFVEERIGKNELKNIFLKDQITEDGSQIIYAKKGKLLNIKNNNYLILYNGKFINKHKGQTSAFSFEETKFNLSKYSSKTTTYTKIQELKSIVLLKCLEKLLILKDFKSKFKYDFLRCDQSSLKNINQELYKRFIIPFYIPAIALISSLLILISKININYNRNKYFIFTLGIVTLVISEVSSRYIGINNSNIFFLLMPLLLFFLFYMCLIFNIRVKK